MPICLLSSISMADTATYRPRWSGTRRANLKKSLLVSLALVLAFAFATVALVPPSVARADGWDVPKLTKLLLTGDELTAALGPGLTDTVEVKPTSTADIVSVGRG